MSCVFPALQPSVALAVNATRLLPSDLLPDKLEDVLQVELEVVLIQVPLVCAWTKEVVKATNSPAIRVVFIEGDVGGAAPPVAG